MACSIFYLFTVSQRTAGQLAGTTPKGESMADEITRFPGAASISFDELLATVDDVAGDYNQLFRIALKSFQNAGPSIRPDTGAEVKDFFEDLALAYFAMGTLLGAKRELMVRSLLIRLSCRLATTRSRWKGATTDHSRNSTVPETNPSHSDRRIVVPSSGLQRIGGCLGRMENDLHKSCAET